MTRVSVIVPVYNVETYLRKCVDSIIAQTYKNIEIILINDGSNDTSPLICDEYANIDKRIKVIHKKNGGISDARNAGISETKGEYIAFVDSDDYIHRDFIKILLREITKHDADISVCSSYKVYGDKIVAQPKKVNFAILNNVEAMRDVFIFPSLCGVTSWNKLYKKALFTKNSIAFPFGKIYEDDFTTYKLFYYANRVVFINEPLYYYTQREGSTMNSRFSKKNFDIIEASRSAGKWIKKYNLPLTKEVQAYQFVNALQVLDAMLDAHFIDDKMWNDVSSWILKNKKTLFTNRYINRKQNAFIIMLHLGKKPYKILRSAKKVSNSWVRLLRNSENSTTRKARHEN